MVVFLKCEAEEVWNVVEMGPNIFVKTVYGNEVLTLKAECTVHDKEMVK